MKISCELQNLPKYAYVHENERIKKRFEQILGIEVFDSKTGRYTACVYEGSDYFLVFDESAVKLIAFSLKLTRKAPEFKIHITNDFFSENLGADLFVCENGQLTLGNFEYFYEMMSNP